MLLFCGDSQNGTDTVPQNTCDEWSESWWRAVFPSNRLLWILQEIEALVGNEYELRRFSDRLSWLFDCTKRRYWFISLNPFYITQTVFLQRELQSLLDLCLKIDKFKSLKFYISFRHWPKMQIYGLYLNVKNLPTLLTNFNIVRILPPKGLTEKLICLRIFTWDVHNMQLTEVRIYHWPLTWNVLLQVSEFSDLFCEYLCFGSPVIHVSVTDVYCFLLSSLTIGPRTKRIRNQNELYKAWIPSVWLTQISIRHSFKHFRGEDTDLSKKPMK